MHISSRKALSFFGMLFLSLGILISSASDSFSQNHTVISNDITSDTTWDLSGSPYVIDREIVLYEINPANNKPVVLNIIGQNNNPVIIKIAPNIDIYFNGIVNANNVIFTSLNDDFGFAYYGSTGNPLPGDWDGIHVSNIKSKFRGTSFRYGDYIECIGSAVEEFFNCDFENLSRYGILCQATYTENCYPRIRNCDFVNIGEPFVDTNANGKRDSGETYYDYNTNAGYDEGIAIMMSSPSPFLTQASPTIEDINDIVLNTDQGVSRGGYPLGLYGNAFPPFISTFRKIVQDANDSTFKPSILIGGLISKNINYTLPIVTDTVNPAPLPYTIGSSSTQYTEAADWHFIIGPYASLQLQNQTILKFRRDVNFRIDGTIIFPQGESKIVYFTSVNDDSIGGKLVGSSGTPAPGDWGILRFNHDNTITNGFFSYGTEIFFNQLTEATAFNNNTVIQFAENDLHCFAAEFPCFMEISSNLLSNGRTAIFMETQLSFNGPCSPMICDNNIIGHSYYPIKMKNTCNPVYSASQCGENSVENENYPAILVSGAIQQNAEISWQKIADLSYVITGSDFQLTRGQDYDGIATKVEYNILIDTNQTWNTNTLINGTLNPNTDLTDVHNYTIIANNSTSVTVTIPTGERGLNEYAMPIGGDSYSITNYDASLTIGQGNVVKLDLNKSFTVDGNIELMGTSAHPVVFTSIRDDDFGRIIEPGHPDPAKGDWYKFTLFNNDNIIENSIFRYGSSIVLESCSPHLKNNVISGFLGNAIHCIARTAPSSPDILNNQISCNTVGIYCETINTFGVNQSNPRMTNNDFYRNDEYAVFNTQTIDIDASNNWWGHYTGPWGTQTECSGGQGDAISKHVIACGLDENGNPNFSDTSRFSVDNESPVLLNINPPPNTMSASVATDISFDLIDTGAGLDFDTFSVQVDHSDGRRPIYVVKDGLIQNDPDSGIPFDVEILTIPDGIQFIYNPAQNFTLNAKICVIVTVEDKAFCPNILTEFDSEFCFTPGVFQGLSDGRVDPKCGNTDTEFHYQITFFDDTLNAPTFTTLYIDNTAYNMTLESGDPAGGVYGFTTTLPFGYHDFYFEFVTGDGLTLRLPDAAPATFPGPFVASDYETLAWPMFMQNQFHDAHSYAAGPAQSVQVDWSFTAGGDFFSSPVVDLNNNVYCASFDDGKIFKFDSTGNLLWSYDTHSQIQATPAIDRQGNLFVGDYKSNLYRISPDGSQVASYYLGSEGDYVISSPTIDLDDNINQSGSFYRMFNLTKDFNVNWWLAGGTPKVKVQSTSCIYFTGRTAFGSNNSYIYCGDADGLDSFGNELHGIPRWKYDTAGAVESSPAVDCEGNFYVGSNDYNIYSINYDGSLIWSYPTSGMVKSSPAIGWNNTIYVGSMDYSLYALRSDTGGFRWSYKTNDKILASPAIDANENIFIGSYDGSLYCLNNNGGVHWIWDSPNGGVIHSSVAIGPDGRIYVAAGNTLYALKEGVNNSPFLSSGKVSSLINSKLGYNFSYTVNYFDKDGDKPTERYVVIDGYKYSMNLFNGFPANGKYQYQKYLKSGIHDYYFTYTDSAGNSVRLPTSGTFSGPTINLPSQTSSTMPSNSISNSSTPPIILMAGFANSKVTSKEGGILKILALVNDFDKDAKDVEVFYNGIPTGLKLKDDGTQEDGEFGDSIFGLKTKVSPGVDKGLYLIELMAQDYDGNFSNLWPYITVDLNPEKIDTSSLDMTLIEKFYYLLSSENYMDTNIILAGGYLNSIIDCNTGGELCFSAFTKSPKNNEKSLYVIQNANYGLNIGNSMFLLEELNRESSFNQEVKCLQFSSTLCSEIERGIYLFMVKNLNNENEILFPFLTVN